MWDSGINGALVSAITGGASGLAGGVVSNFQNNQYTNNTSNLQQQSTQNQPILPINTFNQEQNKTTQNGNIEQILPTQNYYYEKSDNTKINNLRKDANKYWDNSEKTKNYVNMLEKIIQDKDIDIRLDTNLKTPDGKIANGSYSNGVITINPNSTRTGEFIAVHELTHAIGTDQMRNIVQKYRESNAEFDRTVKSLLQNYNATELTEEAMSDVAGQLFGNQEFINNLAQTEPSLFKKIYNEIKYLWHQFTGYKNQDQFINDLQYKWEQAYRNNAKLNETTNYSIAGRKSLENIRNNKILYNSGINSYNQAQQMASRNISNEQIRQKTGWFQDKNGDWKYEFSDKDMAIKNIRYEQNKNYKLGNILKHDTLFELYPELKQLNVKIDNTNKISGNYNKNSKTITLSKQLLNNSKRLEGTLIHEIQHAIQDIEGFEKGTTSKLSKERYYNNLGEIEADNTRKRFIDEKYNNRDVRNEAPESSKANPKHRNYDNYINNRTTLDKVKDGMFKYFKGLGDSNEILQENNQENIQQDIRLVDDGRNGRHLKESENNSGSFSMSENKRFDVTGNENLNNASTLFFRTREDGIYYVQATNAAGNITYDGTFIDKHSLEKTLGNEIAEYITNNSEHTNNEIYLTSSKVENETDYMMSHRPSEEYGNGSNFESNMNGVFEHPEWYMNMREEYNIESLNALQKVRNKPNATITIYRATPGNKINPGDWVTPSRKYAELHNNSQLNGAGNILELKVKAKDILWGGDDINEFGYFPDVKKYSLPTKEWQEYLEDNYKPTGTRTNLKDIKLPKQLENYQKTKYNTIESESGIKGNENDQRRRITNFEVKKTKA